VREDWVACPNCYTRLKKPCHQCGKSMELSWNLCPFCGTPAPGMRRENLTIDEALRNLPLAGEQDEVQVGNDIPPGETPAGAGLGLPAEDELQSILSKKEEPPV
jgi:hypothetical protein